jgi:hypothetical protein
LGLTGWGSQSIPDGMKYQQHWLKKAVWPMVMALGILSQSLVQTGCVIAAVGAGAAGTVAYFRGELVSTFDNTFDEALEATQKAVDELELIRISEKKDALSAVFTLQTAKDKKVSIILDKLDHEVTSVTIRVGIVGDESLSLTILGKIRENL